MDDTWDSYLDCLGISSNGCPVHGREAILPSEVNVSTSRQQGHDALHVAMATTCQTQRSVCASEVGEKHLWSLYIGITVCYNGHVVGVYVYVWKEGQWHIVWLGSMPDCIGRMSSFSINHGSLCESSPPVTDECVYIIYVSYQSAHYMSVPTWGVWN